MVLCGCERECVCVCACMGAASYDSDVCSPAGMNSVSSQHRKLSRCSSSGTFGSVHVQSGLNVADFTALLRVVAFDFDGKHLPEEANLPWLRLLPHASTQVRTYLGRSFKR